MSARPTMVTRAQAETVLAALIKRYDAYINGGVLIPADESGPEYRCEALDERDRPFLRFRNNGSWELIWEAGPDEWAYRFTMGGLDEEVAGTLIAEFGVAPKDAGKVAYEQPAEFSPKLSVQPSTSYSVGIWLA